MTFSSLLTLALLLFAAVRENFATEWRIRQREYKRILVAKARDESERALARRFPIELRQIVAPDLDRVDRCVSCHLGLDDPRMADVPQPFRSHPAPFLVSHDPEKFGCTVCHDGQGRATTKREAHAREKDTFWERPLLPARLSQSSCGVCHDPQYLGDRGAPLLARGFELFRGNGCQGCHKRDGRGGPLGPPLDQVGHKGVHSLPFAHVTGERTVWNWHRQHLKDPRKVVPASQMPKVDLPDEEIAALTTYLLSVRSENLTERMTPRDKYEERHRTSNPASLTGEQLYRQYCFACHGEGLETLLHDTLHAAVPAIRNLDFLAVASEDFLLTSIRNGRPGTAMPAWDRRGGGLSEEELRRLVPYLLKERPVGRAVTFVVSPTADPVKGKRLWDESCATCHGTTRGGGESSWLGSPGFQETYSDALIGHVIKYGRAGTLMNPYGKEAGGELTDPEISDLVRFIRTLK